MPSRNKTLYGCLCALGCEFLFGFSYIFTKDVTANVSPFALLGWRFIIALIAVQLLSLAGLIHIRLKGKNIRQLISICLLAPVIYYIGETFGISWTTASESSTVIACLPVLSVVASSVMLKEKPTRLQLLGILVTLCGVLITVFAVGQTATFSVPGYVMLLLAVLSYTLFSVYVEKSDCTNIEVTYMMIVVGAVVFPLIGLFEALIKGTLPELLALPFSDRSFLRAVLYQSLGCSILAFFLSNQALQTIGVNRTASFIGISTVVAILAGVIFLNEPFSPLQILGAAVILAGVYIANTARPAVDVSHT